MAAHQLVQALLVGMVSLGGVTAVPSKPADAIYDGVMRSPKSTFGIDDNNMTVEVEGRNITLTQDHFFGEECIYEGSIFKSLPRRDSSISAAGTYKCSDFTDGTWSSDYIKGIGGDSFVAILDISEGGSEYEATYIGFSGSEALVIDNTLFFSSESNMEGNYEGSMNSTDFCAGSSFSVSPTDLNIAIDRDAIEFTQDAFFEGECRFTGKISADLGDYLEANGTYMCSNFDEGTWSTDSFGLTSDYTFLAEVNVEVPDRGCDYKVRYSGILR